MAVSTSISGISAYDAWFGSGVPGWPGFPSERFGPLNSSINKFKGMAGMFRILLNEALDFWDQLSTSGDLPGENILRANLLVLLARLTEVDRSASTLISDAGRVKVEAAELSGAVDRFIVSEINERNRLQAEIDSLHIQMQIEERAYREARDELEGSSGFLNGFLTGITFGIYNPIKQNMDRASQAISRINGNMATIRQNMNIMTRRQSEINEAKNVVSRLGIVDTDMANCQNATNQALVLLTDAVHSFERADAAERPQIFAAFVQAGAARMSRLRQWEQDFSGLI